MATLSYHNKRVLVVDDQRPFLILLRGIMNNLGAQSVVVVQNGESAIAACRQEKFDIIVSDLHLGSDRKNGYQLLEELRVRKLIRPTTVYIMVSADSDRPMVLGSIEKQPDDYLIKPFSQAQLHNRIAKAYHKRISLRHVYDKAMNGDNDGAIAACRKLISTHKKYSRACAVVLTDLLWREQRYEEALSLLESLSQSKSLPWVTIALAKTHLLMDNTKKAMFFARKICMQRLFMVDGLDLLAQAHMQSESLEEALDSIQKALSMAPYSLTRQFLGCEIARLSGDYEMAKICCQAILEQSKKSVHRSVVHLCNYVRSILDAAEQAEDKQQKNKFQQEAMLVLQRNRHDELLTRTKETFDYSVYEDLVGARINFIDGKLHEAKRLLNETQFELRKKFEQYPMTLAPDSIDLMCDLGEYEELGELLGQLKQSDIELDANLKFLINKTEDRTHKNKQQYDKHRQDGQKKYAQGQYQGAYEAFLAAQELAPMNTAIAIHLLQCLLKLLDKMSKPDLSLMMKCRQTYRMLDGMRLSDDYQAKFNNIRDDVKDLLERT